MKRSHLLPTAAATLGLALLAAPAPAQHQSTDAPWSAAAEADRPAELLRMAQGAMRRGQTAQANELLERAETRLLPRDGAAAEPAAPRPVQGEPAHHVSEARRALMNRDRAEAMRHTNLAIATVREDGDAAGGDADRSGAQGGGQGAGMGGGRSGAVDLGMGTLPVSGNVVVRDGGTSTTSVNRAEGIVLAQSGGRGGNALPPGEALPGWSGPRSGALGGSNRPGGGTAATPGAPGTPAENGRVPDSFSGRGAYSLDFSSPLSGPGAAGVTGGAPARVGGAPPSDTSRAPGSSGIGPLGPTGFGMPGPAR